MKESIIKRIVAVAIVLTVSACATEPVRTGELRTFETSFESITDFDGFYIVPQDYHNSCSHDLSTNAAHSGTYAHQGWIYASYDPSTTFVNNNHRAYPTVQLHKLPDGAFITPCWIALWVWLDIELHASTDGGEDEWFSFATLSADDSDNWNRVVCVNLSYDGFVHLMHVPNQGEQEHIFQTTNLTFPMRQWVRLDMYIDFDRDAGYAKVWQDGVLASWANVEGGVWTLPQAHFGLYAPPSLASGTVYNDDLVIREVDGEPSSFTN